MCRLPLDLSVLHTADHELPQCRLPNLRYSQAARLTEHVNSDAVDQLCCAATVNAAMASRCDYCLSALVYSVWIRAGYARAARL
jgi:hypothetical protein